jgi:hypothetical protein
MELKEREPLTITALKWRWNGDSDETRRQAVTGTDLEKAGLEVMVSFQWVLKLVRFMLIWTTILSFGFVRILLDQVRELFPSELVFRCMQSSWLGKQKLYELVIAPGSVRLHAPLTWVSLIPR